MKKERLDDGIVSFLGQIRWAQFEKWPMKKKTEIGEGAACVGESSRFCRLLIFREKNNSAFLEEKYPRLRNVPINESMEFLNVWGE